MLFGNISNKKIWGKVAFVMTLCYISWMCIGEYMYVYKKNGVCIGLSVRNIQTVL